MKNSPIIKVTNTNGEQVNINANHVIAFKSESGVLKVWVTAGSVHSLNCTERSFRSYMNKALGVLKKETEEA